MLNKVFKKKYEQHAHITEKGTITLKINKPSEILSRDNMCRILQNILSLASICARRQYMPQQLWLFSHWFGRKWQFYHYKRISLLPWRSNDITIDSISRIHTWRNRKRPKEGNKGETMAKWIFKTAAYLLFYLQLQSNGML